MRIGFDSTILVYAGGGEHVLADQPKVARSLSLLKEFAPVASLVAPAQAIGEGLRVLAGKMKRPDAVVAKILTSWQRMFDVAPTTIDTIVASQVLARSHRFQHWDAVIVTACLEASCTVLLSEDMHHGFVWRGMTIINPFADPPHPLLASLL